MALGIFISSDYTVSLGILINAKPRIGRINRIAGPPKFEDRDLFSCIAMVHHDLPNVLHVTETVNALENL